jgi:hypothetical protein
MNSNGGGVYAMDWRIEGIRIWYFAPNAIPSDIKSGNPTTSGWGTVLSSLRVSANDLANGRFSEYLLQYS